MYSSIFSRYRFFSHVYFDISWSEAAKYLVASPEATRIFADLMKRHPDRFLFGTDGAAPVNQSNYLSVFYQYHPLWKELHAQTSWKIRLGNYQRIFDEGRRRVRAWEEVHVGTFDQTDRRTAATH